MSWRQPELRRLRLVGEEKLAWGVCVSVFVRVSEKYGQAARIISTGRLNMLPCVHRRPINQIISLVPSVTLKVRGWLILRGASHLDAFSGYPVRTWLPSDYRWHDNWYTRGSSTSVLSY